MPLHELRFYLESMGDRLAQQTAEGYVTAKGVRYIASREGHQFDNVRKQWVNKIIFARV